MSLPIENSSGVGSPPLIIVAEPLTEDAIFIDSRSDRRLSIAALGGVVLVVIAVLSVLGRSLPDSAARVEESTAAEPSLAENTVRPTAIPTIQPTNWLSTWPNPPDDHAPIVIGSPGLGSPLVANAPGHTLVYVNSIDRPTIIDLVRGGRQELTISIERSVDYFLVEDGEVVDDDPLNPDLPIAGGRAVPVFVHQSTDAERREVREPSPYAGPHLCLDAGGCDDLWWNPIEISSGRQRVERMEIDSSVALGQLFDPTTRDGRGRFVLVVGEAGDEVKVPVPREGTTIWVIADALR